MKKIDFKASEFTNRPKAFRKSLEYDDLVEESQKLFDEVMKIDSLKLLVAMLDQSGHKAPQFQGVIKYRIRYLLDLEYGFGYLIDYLEEIVKKINEKIEEIDEYKGHRHKTFGGMYTEKAVY